jgi:hypothetical protein
LAPGKFPVAESAAMTPTESSSRRTQAGSLMVQVLTISIPWLALRRMKPPRASR